MRANIKPTNTDAFTFELPDQGVGATGISNAFVTQTGPTTNVSNNTTAHPLSSTHSDETAKLLTEMGYN